MGRTTGGAAGGTFKSAAIEPGNSAETDGNRPERGASRGSGIGAVARSTGKGYRRSTGTSGAPWNLDHDDGGEPANSDNAGTFGVIAAKSRSTGTSGTP